MITRLALPLVVTQILRRQDQVYRNVPRCESCNADQVQLISDSTPARWKCRVCKHSFTKEPPVLAFLNRPTGPTKVAVFCAGR